MEDARINPAYCGSTPTFWWARSSDPIQSLPERFNEGPYSPDPYSPDPYTRI